MKTTPCTEKKYYAFTNAPRCGAKARTNDYKPCRNPAIRHSTKCRMHGGKGSGAKKGNTNAFKHGHTTAEMKEFRFSVKQLIKDTQNIKNSIS